MDRSHFDKSCAALCAWREARGEGRDGLRAVLHVIANRATLSHKTWADVVYQPLQFSSMTYRQDGQLTRVPPLGDGAFDECMELSDAIYAGNDFDLTSGATHYFADSIPMPDWAKQMTFVIKIGHHGFYK